jgi:GDPmannose 4,6-dehydratase
MLSTMAKTAFIVGADGQDGKLLEAHLKTRGYRLACIDKGTTRFNGLPWRMPVDITHASDVFEVVRELQPDEIYHFAAIHQSAEGRAREDLALYRDSYEVNFFSLLNFLEAIRLFSNKTRLFYAASSHVFGHSPRGAAAELQNEETPLSPDSVYAMTKVDGLLACRRYRMFHQVFAAVGILYNHESSFRDDKFLTKKVIRAVVDIKRGGQNKLVLGDLSAKVDWGYAPDYVEAMHAILSAEVADEFVVATGIGHTVMEFVEAAFLEAGISNWKQYVLENPENLGTRRRSGSGDPSKLTRVTKWTPKTSFLEMIRSLLRDEMLMSTRIDSESCELQL